MRYFFGNIFLIFRARSRSSQIMKDQAAFGLKITSFCFDSASLKVTAALETVSKEAIEPYEGLPNQFFSSDHLPLKAHFKFAASQ